MVANYNTYGRGEFGELLVRKVSTSYDQEKNKYFLVNNHSGKAIHVQPTGQLQRIYDLKISGVAPTKERNPLAGDVVNYDFSENSPDLQDP